MGKKYDAYEKAAQAETQARTRLEAEKVGGDLQAIDQASRDFQQAHLAATTTWEEVIDDPEG